MKEFEPWVGFDLDGTLAKHVTGRFQRGIIGKPVPKMMKLLQEHLDKGDTVKIFTARVARNSKERRKIQHWLLEQGLPALEVTATKDPGLIKLYDDRAQGVVKNTGELK